MTKRVAMTKTPPITEAHATLKSGLRVEFRSDKTLFIKSQANSDAVILSPQETTDLISLILGVARGTGLIEK